MKVSLFIPCLTDVFFPRTGMNMATILERLGISVQYDPRQTCCGQPAFNSGYGREAADLACRFIDVFSEADYVVAPSGSCSTMIKVFYPEQLDLPSAWREKALALREKVFEMTAFIVDVLGVEDVGARFDGRVALHDSCHALRELRVSKQPRALLRRVRGLDLVELDHAEVCCGFGGTFAVKHAALSTAMGVDKIRDIDAARADVVTAVDSSCLMHIDGLMRRAGMRTRALHIADILAAS